MNVEILPGFIGPPKHGYKLRQVGGTDDEIVNMYDDDIVVLSDFGDRKHDAMFLQFASLWFKSTNRALDFFNTYGVSGFTEPRLKVIMLESKNLHYCWETRSMHTSRDCQIIGSRGGATLVFGTMLDYCWAQLCEAIAEGFRYDICERASCRRPFRQTKRRHYCSASCRTAASYERRTNGIRMLLQGEKPESVSKKLRVKPSTVALWESAVGMCRKLGGGDV